MMEYAESALRSGLQEIGISDHCPMPNGFDAEWRMDESELDNYLEELTRVQAAMLPRGLTVRCALEADFHPGTEDYIRQLLAYHDWDYVIGSVHFIDTWGFDNPEDQAGWQRWSLAEAWCAYFQTVADSAASGLFDIIGHPDLLKKYGHRQPDDAAVLQAQQAMLTAVKAADVALEISSAGLRKPVAEIYPQASVVAQAATLGIPFAYGSDAHAPNDVAHGMQACLRCLDDCGVSQVAQFTQRQRQMQGICRVG
jgi:histidinol-phosphatase (PHP family)